MSSLMDCRAYGRYRVSSELPVSFHSMGVRPYAGQRLP